MMADMKMWVVLVALQMAGCAYGQLLPGIPEFLGWGSCSDAAPQADLDLAKFSGTWFTIERIPNQYVSTDSCVYANYTLSGQDMKVKEFGKTTGGKFVTLDSTVKFNGVGKPLTVVSEGVPEAPLKIMATDYETYSCMQSCLGYGLFKAEFAWILTKKPSASVEAVKICKKILKDKMDFNNSAFKRVKQGRGCDYPAWARS